jgi:hypothetical protein
VLLVAAIVAGAVAFAVAGAGEARHAKNEREVTLEQVPAAVRATVLKEAGDHKVTEVQEITRGDVTTYEAEWVVGGDEVEITVAADGKLLGKKTEPADDDEEDGGKNEKEVTLDQVPAAVQATILKEAGDHKVTEVQEVTRGDVRTYEAEWVVGGDEVEVTVAADGKFLGKKTEPADDNDDGDDQDDDVE